MDETRIEVGDEWLPFYRKGKPVALFAIEKCDLDRRFERLNNIDAIDDRDRGLKVLLEAIRGTFDKRSKPKPVTMLNTFTGYHYVSDQKELLSFC